MHTEHQLEPAVDSQHIVWLIATNLTIILDLFIIKHLNFSSRMRDVRLRYDAGLSRMFLNSREYTQDCVSLTRHIGAAYPYLPKVLQSIPFHSDQIPSISKHVNNVYHIEMPDHMQKVRGERLCRMLSD